MLLHAPRYEAHNGTLRLGRGTGGSPVLGVCGSVVKVHGRSRANAIANAITSGANFIRHNGVERIQNEIAKGAEGNDD